MKQEEILESFLKVIGEKEPFEKMSAEEKEERLEDMKQTQKEIRFQIKGQKANKDR